MKNLAFRVAVFTALAACGNSQTRLDLRTQSKSIDFTNASSTRTVKSGSTLPATCAVSELFFNSGSNGTGLYTCAPANVWSPAGLPSTGFGGDVQGSPSAVVVQGLQGRPVANTAPSAGQLLGWNGTTGAWSPVSSQSTPNFAKTFSAVTSVTILGSEHNQGTANLILSCWDGATPAQWVEPSSVKVDPSTFDVTVNFAAAQSGRCVVNGSGGFATGSGGGGGAVASVFGRTGTVAAQTGDYAFPQISGTAAVGQLPSGIPAANIGPGTVNNAAFATLANVTSDLQAQLNAKAAAAHTHIGGGDLSGDVTNTTVVGLQKMPVANTTPLNGQALVFNGTSGQWQPQMVAGGSGGATSTAQLTDLNVSFTSATVLTIGGNCSTTSPCNVRFGTTVISVLSSATVTVSGNTSGTAYFYVTSDGTVNAASLSLPLTCSTTCSVQTNVAQFPLNSIPLATWTVLNGQWTSGGGTDRRAFQSTNVVAGGSGIALVDNGTQTTVSVDPAVVPTFLTNSATVSFAAIANQSCSAELTMALSGAAAGDSVAPGWPVLPAGVIGSMRISAANTVSVMLCNLSGASQTPGALTVRATVVRGF